MEVTVFLGGNEERVEVAEEELFNFPRGMVGFEECTRYALFDLGHPLYLLQSVDDPGVGFVLIDPLHLEPGYRVEISREERMLLKLGRGERPELLCVVTLSPEGVPAGVNLRAPVAINPAARRGLQPIPQESRYGVRHPLVVDPDGGISLAGPRGGSGGRDVPLGGDGPGCMAGREAVRC